MRITAGDRRTERGGRPRRLRQQISDAHGRGGRSERREVRARGEHLPAGVTPAERGGGLGPRLTVYLEDAVLEVEDPVVIEPGSGVETALVLPIEAEARLGHLNGENWTRGMRPAVVVRAPANDGDVRLGLGVLVEPDGPLRADGPPRAECRLERSCGLLNRRVVGG